ncbi:MAG TPA: hypothetical protein VMU89_13245 [Thermomicrobiaceae bacterium]|nr:hypothetical protein [Thermomicrobiaceae bacterium]
MTSEHDRVAAHVAATRFPFPGQVDWPVDYRTIVNVPEPLAAIPGPNGSLYPDIVILDGTGRVREVGEVEPELGQDCVARWLAGSASADDRTETGVRHFFVYVPEGLESAARTLLDEGGVSYAGLRTYRVEADGEVTIVPVMTPGGTKDHR